MSASTTAPVSAFEQVSEARSRSRGSSTLGKSPMLDGKDESGRRVNPDRVNRMMTETSGYVWMAVAAAFPAAVVATALGAAVVKALTTILRPR